MTARIFVPILALALACSPATEGPGERRPAASDQASISRLPGGMQIARVRQQIDGVEIYRSDVKVVTRNDRSVVALSGAPARLPGTRPDARGFSLSPGEALARALGDKYGVSAPSGLAVAAPNAPDAFVRLELPQPAPVRLSQPAGARKVYYPDGDRLVPAYQVEFIAGSDADLYLVAADDGRILERHDLVAADSFRYRVYAAESGDKRPLDGPIADFTPHPTGEPDGTDPPFAPPRLVSMESFKQTPAGAVDPWLPAGATETRGNNVDAYADLQRDDGLTAGDFRATTTAPGAFDKSFDVTQEPGGSRAQVEAAITNVFYVVNWLHDYWYDSGFDEAAGNAQTDNYGRRGFDGDEIHAEVHDFGGLNNANMATLSDGLSPRMQMYLWSPSEVSSLVAGGEAVGHRVAQFGAASFDLAGELVLAVDGTAPAGDACQVLTDDVAGKIVLVDRGTCSFASKAQKAQNAGAAGVLIANSSPELMASLGNQQPPLDLAIPVLGISGADGEALKDGIARGTTTVRMTRRTVPPGRDGALDNMIVAHEWGHYLHHRLSSCFTAQCDASSEGFADFVALHLIVRENDDLERGTYGVAIYAPKVVGDTGYFGIRRFPYSIDFAKNALTFGHIAADAILPPVPQNPNGAPPNEAHNAGEVWASMLFEAYVAVQRSSPVGFTETQRMFADALVLGLQLAPADATFLEYRDSILAAFAILDPDRFEVVAEAFARRGAGTCAVGPDRFSDTFTPIAESFELAPVIGDVTVAVDDSVTSCDGDGILDAREAGRVTVSVVNRGPATMRGTVVTVAADREGVTFPDGASVTLGDVPRLASGTGRVKVALDERFIDAGAVKLTVTVTNRDACVPSATSEVTIAVQRDEVPGSSRTDDVEAALTAWTRTGDEGGWAREAIDPTHHQWHGEDRAGVTDAELVSPPLPVGAAPLRVSFQHAYNFDYASATHYDGGVIELSQDGGATWQDVESYGADPHYNSAGIHAGGGNPLGGRRGYGRTNARYPAMDAVSLDFGTALAGQTVRLRFRIGTDEAIGAPGWRIDDIAVEGVIGLPFTSVAANARTCGLASPPPDAGPTPDAARPDAGSVTAGDDEGGGCSVAGRGGFSARAVWLLVGLAALLRRRRRAAARTANKRSTSPSSWARRGPRPRRRLFAGPPSPSGRSCSRNSSRAPCRRGGGG